MTLARGDAESTVFWHAGGQIASIMSATVMVLGGAFETEAAVGAARAGDHAGGAKLLQNLDEELSRYVVLIGDGAHRQQPILLVALSQGQHGHGRVMGFDGQLHDRINLCCASRIRFL